MPGRLPSKRRRLLDAEQIEHAHIGPHGRDGGFEGCPVRHALRYCCLVGVAQDGPLRCRGRLSRGFAQDSPDRVGRREVVLRDEVRVDVHGEARRRVAQALLHRLDVRARPDEQRRLRVPELVQVVADVGPFVPALPPRRVRVAHRGPELAQSVGGEVLAAPAVERVGVHELEERVGAHRRLPTLVEGGDLHRAGLLLLPLGEEHHGPVVEAEPAVRLLALGVPDLVVGRVLLAHVDALALEVDVAPHEPEDLASAHAGREGDPDHHGAVGLLLGVKRHRELERLLVGERLALLRLRPWGLHVPARVRVNQLVGDRVVHDEQERGVELVEGAPRGPLRGEELVVCVRDLFEGEVLQQRVTEEPLDLADLELVVLQRERRVPSRVDAALVPCARVAADGELFRVLDAAFELDAVLLERAPRVGLCAVDRLLGGPDVASGLGIAAEVVPDALHLALDDFLDLT